MTSIKRLFLASFSAVLVVSALGGCSSLAPSGTSTTPTEQGEAEMVSERAALEAAFPGMDASNPTQVLNELKANFAAVRNARVETSGGPVSSSVALTAAGVRTKAEATYGVTETIVLGGDRGWVRGSKAFWVGNGMDRRAAADAAGTWVKTKAITGELQTLEGIKRELLSKFDAEWGEGTGPLILSSYAGQPSVRVSTGVGEVVAAGDPLLPVRSVFGVGDDRVVVQFSYPAKAEVAAPKGDVSLDTVVYR